MKKGMTFEKAMNRLEEIVSALEAEETPLDLALSLYSESTELIAFCNKQLEQAQVKIEKLLPGQTAEEAQTK